MNWDLEPVVDYEPEFREGTSSDVGDRNQSFERRERLGHRGFELGFGFRNSRQIIVQGRETQSATKRERLGKPK